MPRNPRWLWLAAWLACAAPAAAADGLSPLGREPTRQTGLGDAIGGAVAQVAGPAYRFIEKISDGAYDFLRAHVVANILPDRLNKNLPHAPQKDSSAAFARAFEKKEARYLERLTEAYPTRQDVQTGYYSPAEINQWRSWAQEEQAGVAVDSFRDTLLDRYQLEPFGRTAEGYAKDRRNWDAGFLAMSSLIGGAFAYVGGIHADTRVGDFKLRMDVRPGMRIREALQSASGASRVAGFEVGYKNSPLSFSTDWGAGRGGLYDERYGLNYRLRY